MRPSLYNYVIGSIFCFAFFINMKERTQTNASFLLCFMLESHFSPQFYFYL